MVSHLSQQSGFSASDDDCKVAAEAAATGASCRLRRVQV